MFCNFLQTFVPGNTLKLNPADSFRLVKESAVISDIPALSSQIAAAQQYIMNGKSQHKNISAEHPRYIYARAATKNDRICRVIANNSFDLIESDPGNVYKYMEYMTMLDAAHEHKICQNIFFTETFT